MKKDKELQKIQGLMNRLEEFQIFIHSGDFAGHEIRRMLDYIANRYAWLFKWISENQEDD